MSCLADGDFMESSSYSRLQIILDDYESGRMSDVELDLRLETLSPEQLGWIARESIRRSSDPTRRQGKGVKKFWQVRFF